MRNFPLLFLLLLFFTACTQAPQPFRHERTGFDPTSLRLRDGGTVFIKQLDGAQKPLSQIITGSLADSLAVRNIVATKKAISNPSYILKGVLVANRDAGTMDRGIIYWTFMDRGGNILEETQHSITASYQSWNYGDQVVVDKLVDKAADVFVTYLQDKSELEAQEMAAEDLVRIMVTGVKGATGDGEKALTKAMRLTLRQFGAKVESELNQGVYQLSADIDLLEPFEGQQRIKIDWIVKDDQGEELGRANQNNRVPEGSLDGEWGRLAYTISRAAMGGIGEVVERHRLEKRWERSREQKGTSAPPGKRSPGLLLPF